MSDQTSRRQKALSAAVFGNMLEWYDFAVYSYVATILARNFFPPGDEVAALLATFAVFGVGFVIRPLGAIVIGRIGDVKGRKAAMLITIMMMAVGTVMIALIPSYATIGIAAPLLLVIARLLQSFSVGGEFATAIAFIVEWAPKNKRGYYGSFQQISTVSGLLLGSGVAALLNTVIDPAAMDSWGWRIPFLIGGLIGLIGLYMRRNVDETPAYEQAQAEPTESVSPAEISPVLAAAKAFGFAIIWTVSFYIFLFYMPTFTQRYAGLTRAESLWSNTAGLLLLAICIPLMGKLSDRIGRKPLLLACCAIFLVLPYPLFKLMQGGSLVTILLIQLLVGVSIALYAGPAPATMVEIFRTKTRSTYMSIGYALAATIFGGFAPFIATWLISVTGSPISPTFYVMAAAVVSAIAVLGLRETAHEPLR
ncbi:MAG TPA: MFS transporter [Xanthobacteraceae bacterium]|nr:MFS transporter [Xanthobacteraceae bacterium]